MTNKPKGLRRKGMKKESHDLGSVIFKIRPVERITGEGESGLSPLVENLPGMVYRCRNDKDWTIEFVSKGCFTLTEYLPGDLLENKTLAYNVLIHPDDRDRVSNDIQKAVLEKLPYRLARPLRHSG